MKKSFLSSILLLLAATFLLPTIDACSPAVGKAKLQTQGEFVCMPCGRDCDEKPYNKGGECPHCGMRLVKKSSVLFNDIEPNEVCNYIASNPGTVLLDVRTKDEYNGKANPDFGRLKNAINIPIQELDQRLNELDAYKGKQIIVYCSHSKRSPQASYRLTQNGFTHVTNMAGGISEWRSIKNKGCKEN